MRCQASGGRYRKMLFQTTKYAMMQRVRFIVREWNMKTMNIDIEETGGENRRISSLTKDMPEVLFAPLEGLTTRVYRDVWRRHYTGVSFFYTPFLAAAQTHHFQTRELREIEPYQEDVIPQLLGNHAEDLLWALHTLRDRGYSRVDLNLGCPYPTVFAKGKGSGLLADLPRLAALLDQIFEDPDLPEISVKTRIGIRDPQEVREITRVLAGYPLAQVTIHPRVREQFYEGQPDMEAFQVMKDGLNCPVCYNGDLKTPEAVRDFAGRYPDVKQVMIGRGLLADPMLAEKLAGPEPEAEMTGAERGTAVPPEAGERTVPAEEKHRLTAFLDDLKAAYLVTFSGDRSTLFKLKEMWGYLGTRFPEYRRELLDIKKAKKLSEYEMAVQKILA